MMFRSPRKSVAFVPLAIFCSLTVSPALADEFKLNIDWYTFDGGGVRGEGTRDDGEVITIDATLSQPDAGRLCAFCDDDGMRIEVVGGFRGVTGLRAPDCSRFVAWTGLGDGESWSDAGNWDPAVVPDNEDGNSYCVYIDGQVNGGNGEVILDDAANRLRIVTYLELEEGTELRLANENNTTLRINAADDQVALNNRGILRVPSDQNGIFTASSTLMNSNEILLVGEANSARFSTSAPATFDGGGQVRLAGQNTTFLGLSSSDITNSASHVICGTGQIQGTFTNNGSVVADSEQQTLLVARNPGRAKRNNAVMSAAGGVLKIDGTLTQDALGLLSTTSDASSRIEIIGQETAIVGGKIEQAGDSLVEFRGSATLRDVTIDGVVTVVSTEISTQTGRLAGAINNNGTLIVPGDRNRCRLAPFDAEPVFLNGEGEIILQNPDNAELAFGLGGTFVNGAGHAIRGSGLIRAALENDGTILAEVQLDRGLLTLEKDTSDRDGIIINRGRLAANGGETRFSATLDISRGVEQFDSGLVEAINGGVVQINNDIRGRGGNGRGGRFRASGGKIIVDGFDVSGDDIEEPPGVARGDKSEFEARGDGVMQCNNLDNSGGSFGLYNGYGATFHENVTLRYDPRAFIPPSVFVDAASSFTAKGPYVQDAGMTYIDGVLTVDVGLDLNDGALRGHGRVAGDVRNRAGVNDLDGVQPGDSEPSDSIGTLTIDGGYIQNCVGALRIELAGTGNGQFDTLVVTGQATLGGKLTISAIRGFTPALGQSFRVLQYSSRAEGSSFDFVRTVNFPPTLTVEILADAAGVTVRVVKGESVTGELGDINCDGTVNFDDIDAFVVALVDEAEYEELYPDCDFLLADANRDCEVNFDDIDAFVECVINGECPQ
jgi:hypothetical protein